MKELQKQKGSTDCGLFAIAVMTSLAHKEDPSTTKHDQNKMKQHLIGLLFQQVTYAFFKTVNLIGNVNDFSIVLMINVYYVNQCVLKMIIF